MPWHTGVRPILTKVMPAVIGLALLLLIIAWLGGLFTEKIEPGRLQQSVAELDKQETDVVHEVIKDYMEESVGTLKAASRTEI